MLLVENARSKQIVPGDKTAKRHREIQAKIDKTDEREGRSAKKRLVGNEDGAHHVSDELFQALNHVGFSLAPNAVAYWVGGAMGRTDFADLRKVPDVVINAVDMLARNTTYLPRPLAAKQYPGEG